MQSLPEISRRIDFIFRKYYQDVSRRKFVHLSREGEAYIDALHLDPEKFNWWVDRYRLKDAVYSYYFDVIKYKEYHFNPKSDDGKDLDPVSPEFMDRIHSPNPDKNKDKVISASKVAAFTAKWLIKYMPIYIFPKSGVLPSPEEKAKMSDANAIFALEHSLGLMGRDARLQQKSNIDDLFYHLKYRPIDDRSLILAFSILGRS